MLKAVISVFVCERRVACVLFKLGPQVVRVCVIKDLKSDVMCMCSKPVNGMGQKLCFGALQTHAQSFFITFMESHPHP